MLDPEIIGFHKSWSNVVLMSLGVPSSIFYVFARNRFTLNKSLF